jgi:hypothetical protein
MPTELKEHLAKHKELYQGSRIDAQTDETGTEEQTERYTGKKARDTYSVSSKKLDHLWSMHTDGEDEQFISGPITNAEVKARAFTTDSDDRYVGQGGYATVSSYFTDEYNQKADWDDQTQDYLNANPEMKLLIKAEVVRKDQLPGIDAAVRRHATNLLSWIGVLGNTGSDNEFNMITRMDHPSIVKALDYSEKSIWLENSGAVFDPQKFSPDEILGVYCQVFSAVKHVTSSETYHNNVGESNITVDKHGRATLLDFNVATDMRADATKHPFSNYISLLKSFRSSVQKFDYPPSQVTRALVEKILDSIPKLEDSELTAQKLLDVMSGVNADFSAINANIDAVTRKWISGLSPPHLSSPPADESDPTFLGYV